MYYNCINNLTEKLKRIPMAWAASQLAAEGQRENMLLVHNTSDLRRQNQLYLSIWQSLPGWHGNVYLCIWGASLKKRDQHFHLHSETEPWRNTEHLELEISQRWASHQGGRLYGSTSSALRAGQHKINPSRDTWKSRSHVVKYRPELYSSWFY